MPIAEADICILIPTYRQPKMARRAVECALGTGAGEIIVSDDCGGDGIVERFSDLADPRLKVVSQETNLGLWPNHLWLINHSVSPWVKFLQHDDLIAPGGLRVLAEHASDDVAIVSAVPVYRNLETGELLKVFHLSAPMRFSSDAYMKRLRVVGNELSTPSCTLIRRSALSSQPEHWRDDVSADWLVNVLAASRGGVVIVPPGPVCTGRHLNQDGQRQGAEKAARRLRKSVAVLRRSPDARIRAVAHVFGLAESVGALRALTSAALRGHRTGYRAWRDTFAAFFGSIGRSPMIQMRCFPRALLLKWGSRQGLHLDTIRV